MEPRPVLHAHEEPGPEQVIEPDPVQRVDPEMRHVYLFA